jgi:hypothetical protein
VHVQRGWWGWEKGSAHTGFLHACTPSVADVPDDA